MAEETSQLSRLESLMAARLETCWSEAEECLEESLDVDQPEDEEDDSEECDIVKGIDEDGEDNDQQLPPSHTSSIVVVDFAALSRRPGAPDSASGGPSRRDKRAFLVRFSVISYRPSVYCSIDR